MGKVCYKQERTKRHDDAIASATSYIRANYADKGLNKIILFGSCARNNVRYESDVDLLLVFDNNVDVRNLQKYGYDLRCHFMNNATIESVDVDVKLVYESTLNDTSAFIQNIKYKGIVL